MPKPLTSDVVTASVAQVPSTSRMTGFCLMMPLVNSLPRLFFSAAIYFASPLICSKHLSAALTAPVTAFEVIVAPVIA